MLSRSAAPLSTARAGPTSRHGPSRQTAAHRSPRRPSGPPAGRTALRRTARQAITALQSQEPPTRAPGDSPTTG
jgi:hypothetical protein